jgi:hypothetical protein
MYGRDAAGPSAFEACSRCRAPRLAPQGNGGALKHDPEKCEAVFRKDHAQTVISDAMKIHPDLIAL